MRYVIKEGKFGMYFYDTKLDRDMTLKEVSEEINKVDGLMEHIVCQKYNMNILKDDVCKLIQKIKG